MSSSAVARVPRTFAADSPPSVHGPRRTETTDPLTTVRALAHACPPVAAAARGPFLCTCLIITRFRRLIDCLPSRVIAVCLAARIFALLADNPVDRVPSTLPRVFSYPRLILFCILYLNKESVRSLSPRKNGGNAPYRGSLYCYVRKG